MAAMPAIPAAMILSAMAAMLNKGVFLTFTIPSKVKLWTWELNVQVRADAYLLSRQAAPQDPLHSRRSERRGLISHVNGSILMILLRWYLLSCAIQGRRRRVTSQVQTARCRGARQPQRSTWPPRASWQLMTQQRAATARRHVRSIALVVSPLATPAPLGWHGGMVIMPDCAMTRYAFWDVFRDDLLRGAVRLYGRRWHLVAVAVGGRCSDP